MSFLYLAIILGGIVGMGIIDWHYKLAFFYDKKRTVLTVGSMVIVFLLWDIAGIALGIFFSGNSPYATGILLAPELPLEEPFFLLLLSYMPLVLYRKFAT